MTDDIIFTGTDAEENEVSISALELKEYTNTEQAQEIADIKTKLAELDKLSELEESISSNAADISSNKTAIENNSNAIESNRTAIEENKSAIENNTTQLTSLTETLTNTSNSISEEVTTRQNADSELKTELSESIKNAIEKENSARIQTENAIKDQIEQEAKDRLDADNELEARIYQEIATTLTNVDFATADKKVKSDLTAYIETVQADVTGEVNNLSTRIDDLQNSLNEEIANRVAADNAMQSNSNSSGSSGGYSSNYEIMTIDHLEQGDVTDNSIFLQSLNAEDSRVTAAQIKKYMAAASQADFDVEVSTRKSEDSKLAARITTETTSRKEQDTELQNQIDSLDSRTTTNENTLNVLTGNGEGSIRKAISDKIAEVVASAPEAFDTLKEIADWVGEHEKDALALQKSITANANAISKETDDRKNEVAKTNLALETETANRINSDSALQESIANLSQALEAEAAERENTKTYIYDSLKQDFENQVETLTLDEISDVLDTKLSEVNVKIGKNSKDIAEVNTQATENKENIETLNNTVFSEKNDERLLISQESGTPKWGTLSSLIKSLDVNTSAIDERGNAFINIPRNAKLVTFSNASDSYDGFLAPFRSVNGNWYIHVANWWYGVERNVTVKGTVYYVV